MHIIERLSFHEKDELDKWFELNGSESKQFLLDLVDFANSNFEELRHFCQSTEPKEFSSLSIVYEALSNYSIDYHDFLFEEIKRIVQYAKESDASVLSILDDIETEEIYDNSEDIYLAIIDHLHAELTDDPNHLEFNFALLELLDFYLIDLEIKHESLQIKKWKEKLEDLTHKGPSKIRLKAKEVLEDYYSTKEDNYKSWFNWIKNIIAPKY